MLIDAGVIQARDVRVFEQRTDVALARHALAETRGPGEARQFERNLAFVGAIGALSQPYTAHAAAADLVQQSIRPDPFAGGRDRFVGAEVRERWQQRRAARLCLPARSMFRRRCANSGLDCSSASSHDAR